MVDRAACQDLWDAAAPGIPSAILAESLRHVGVPVPADAGRDAVIAAWNAAVDRRREGAR